MDLIHQDAAEARNGNKAYIIHQIIQAETKQQTYYRICTQLGRNTKHSPVDCLEIIQKNKTAMITDPQEIENLILQRNQEHFAQARHTPFATSPLSDTYNFA